MSKRRYEPTSLDKARDELFSHIRRCGVLEAEPDQQQEWLAETTEYLAERYPDLSPSELIELRQIGQRYCSPAIPHGKTTAQDVHDVAEAAEGPEAEAPEAEAREAEAPEAEAPEGESPEAKRPEAEAPKTEAREEDGTEADATDVHATEASEPSNAFSDTSDTERSEVGAA